MKVLRVVYELNADYDAENPDVAYWTATVPEVPAVVTQGRSLGEMHRKVRDALALVRNDAEEFVLSGEALIEDLTADATYKELDTESLEIIEQACAHRLELFRVQEELEHATRLAVDTLVKEKKLTYNEVGRLLGITRQRVEQIVNRPQFQRVRARA